MQLEQTLARTLRAAAVGLACVATAIAAQGTENTAPAARPRLSRADLPRLKKLDRAGVFAALGSFDDHGLSDTEFTARALDLLDAKRIPGLAEARRQGDVTKALDAVVRACRADRPTPGKTRVNDTTLAAADAVLANRFSFYGEQYQLPADIPWDENPGTAHWGHDLNRFGFLGPLTQAWATARTTASPYGIGARSCWSTSVFGSCSTAWKEPASTRSSHGSSSPRAKSA